MVVNMYIIGPKKDQYKPVFFSLFDFSKMKRPRPRLQKTNKWFFLVLVLFGLSPVQLQSFASPRTGLSNTNNERASGLSLELLFSQIHPARDQQNPHQGCSALPSRERD